MDNQKLQQEFSDNGYVLIKEFIDLDAIETIKKYFQYGVKQGSWDTLDDAKTQPIKDESSRFSRYADPLIEIVCENSTQELSVVANKVLLPTYTYSRVYAAGDELKKHIDRPSCEYSVTVHVETVGEQKWPIWMQAPGKPPSSYILEPGDAVFYKGCEIEHWREPLVGANFNAQFMMHYVDASGQFSGFKYDERGEMGILK